MQKRSKKRGPFFARAPPVRRLPASAGLGASQRKIAILARSRRIFLREKRTSTDTGNREPAGRHSTTQRNCARGTYAAASTAKNTVLVPARHASDQRRPPAAPPATPPAVPPTAAPGRLYRAAAAARAFAKSDTRAAPSPRAADAHSSCAPSTRRAGSAPSTRRAVFQLLS